ncbi:cellulose synthase complex periplasmic endoglucanase BcsZ [Limnobacter sp. MED105]|uniref:cellulose synthase complex periplasmic endoglucanase BcsZ n=1 Tax=Limnobacter sp. MED105 TaxID=391597 RepID=UPI000156C713|nr:cellulose synthase complex periplasmic endoglucanase BcsZ [Limnobacter sp. MED105]EDM84333.1 endo-1,4-D-glucanase [Limnobacter sp. MED105]
MILGFLNVLFVAGFVLIANPQQALASSQCTKPWPELKLFESKHVQADGRVVDFSTPEQITTSEGQSYAMFFALVDNDQVRFKQLLDWTERNLAPGGVAQSLPAWKWGRVRANQFGMLDANSASDSDLWIAYNLLEAARLWNMPEYKEKGLALMQLIRDNEAGDVPGYGRMVLPGAVGFNPAPGVYRMNPSYLPLFLMRKLSEAHSDSFWKSQPELSAQLIVNSAPKGYVPDWVTVKADGISADIEKGNVGSYDAIRTYLWAGLTARDEPERKALMQAVYAYMQLSNRLGEPLERVDTSSGIWYGTAAPGFYYALEPLAQELRLSRLLLAIKAKHQEVKNQNYAQLSYYDWVLFLYAKGWVEGRYRFDKRGALQVSWNKKC